MKSMSDTIATTVRQLPPHQAFIDRYCAGSAG
jgi:hypothetical protein